MKEKYKAYGVEKGDRGEVRALVISAFGLVNNLIILRTIGMDGVE